MSSPRELALREHLAAFVGGDSSLAGFTDWLVGATWDIDETGDRAAIDLTYDIKLALAEHSRGHVTEDDLRRELRGVFAIDPRAPSAAGENDA